MTEKSAELRDFELRLAQAKPEVRGLYLDFLAEERKEGEKRTSQHTYNVPVETREELLKQAEVSSFHGVDTRSMRKAWDRAGGDSNPPIGGAQND